MGATRRSSVMPWASTGSAAVGDRDRRDSLECLSVDDVAGWPDPYFQMRSK